MKLIANGAGSVASALLLALFITSAPAQTTDTASQSAPDNASRDAATGSEVPMPGAGELAAGDYTGAIEQTRQALNDPASTWSKTELKLVLAESLAVTGDAFEALATYDDAIADAGGSHIVAEVRRALLGLVYESPDGARKQLKSAIDTFRAKDSDQASAEELIAAGQAMAALARDDAELTNEALDYLERAIAVAPGNPATHVAMGDLLLSRYNNTEALEAYRQALVQNEFYPPALLGVAKSQFFDRSSAAMEAVRITLDTQPNYPDALVLLARLHSDLEDYEAANKVLAKALAINQDSPAALTLVSAIQFLQGNPDTARQTREHVRRIAPGYVELYITLSEILGQNRHYQQAARFAVMGANMDPKAWRAHGLLGINRLRLGDEASARAALEHSFSGDPYNVRTKNSLDLMDRLEDFERIGSRNFTLVADPKEAYLLAPKLFPLAGKAWNEFVDRYGIQLRRPLRIEIYPRHEDFSVRTVGLVGVDIVGVSFGPVVAFDSPSAGVFGDFNWGSVLWHELSHSFHLALSRQRVPRWFTEGLAVYEERRGGTGWGNDVSASFLQAFDKGMLNPPSRLNESFLRPTYPEQVPHAYYEAYLLMELVARDHGDEIFRELLLGYGEGKSTEELFRQHLGMEAAELDEAFEVFVREKYADAIIALKDDSPNSFQALMREGREALGTEQYELAEEKLLKAQKIYPYEAGENSSYRLLATLYAKLGRPEDAITQLRLSLDINADAVEAQYELARLLEATGKTDEALQAWDDSLFVRPFSLDTYNALARLHTLNKNWNAAAQAHSSIVTIGAKDPIEARYLFAQALLRAGKTSDARQQVLTTLEQAPMYDDALELLLELRNSKPEEG